MDNTLSSSLVRGSLEECIAKALPTQSDMGVQNLAKTLRDIGVESPDDIQYVEAADLASVLKPIQIRKLLQQVKADLNQGIAQKMGFSSQAEQVQSALVAFQEQNLQAQLPTNLAGMCIQIPAANISPSLNMQSISSSEKVPDSIRTYSEHNISKTILNPVSKQFPINYNFTGSKINQQTSEILNYIPVPNNMNQDNSNLNLRVQVANQHRPNRPFMVDSIHIDESNATGPKAVSPSLTAFQGIGKTQGDVVNLSPTEITNFDSSIWNLENSTKTLVSAPIVVSDDSNSSVICETSSSQHLENSRKQSVNETMDMNTSTSDFLTQHSLDCDALVEESSTDRLKNFKIPWNMMPLSLMDRLEKHKQPEQNLHREMIRVVIAEMTKLCARPTQRQLQEIAHKMVMDYPESLLDPAENSKSQRGYNCILKQLQTHLESMNQPDRGQFNYQKKPVAVTQTKNPGNSRSNYGCLNWQPLKLPPNETKWSLRVKQDFLKNISMIPNWDAEQVTNDMTSTYFLQRKDINNGTSILTLCKDWPFLFEEIGIMVHFKELTNIDLKIPIQEIRNFRARKIIDFMKTIKLSVGQAEVNKILRNLSEDDSNPENPKDSEITAMIPLIMLFLNEDRNILFPVASKKYSASVIKSMNIPETPCLVVCGNSISNSTRFVLCIDEEIVNDKITNFITGVMMLFASYYCFNIHYPNEASGTLEFLQRCLVGINSTNSSNKTGNQQVAISPKVMALQNRLVQFGWQMPTGANNSLPFSKESVDSGKWTGTNPASTDIDLTIVCSNQSNFVDFSSDKTCSNDQLPSQSSQILESERAPGQKANENNNQQNPFSSNQMSFVMSENPANNDLECLNMNQQPNSTFNIMTATLEQSKHFTERGGLKNPRTRPNRPRGRGGSSCRARGSSSSRAHGRTNAHHRRPKEWMREYWRIKKRESRARQEYWLKRMENELVNQLSSDGTPNIETSRKESQGPAIDSANLLLDISNMPSSDGGPGEKMTQNTVSSSSAESQAALPQTMQQSLETPPPLHLSPPSSEMLTLPPPVYKFELQQHSPNWLTTRFRQMWKMRLYCNAAISNGAVNIMVHRDVLLASCTKLSEETNVNVLQDNFLQLTFTQKIKEESLWSLCHFIYDGFLILNADIVNDIDYIGETLGVPYIQHLVAQYKQCALSDPCSRTERDTSIRIKQEFPASTIEDPSLSIKPFIKMENLEAPEGLAGLIQTSPSINAAVQLSTVMTGVISTKDPDYSNELMIVVQVDAESDQMTQLAPSNSLSLGTEKITSTECHQLLKYESL